MSEEARRVLLVGLEDGLLWQVTRALAQAEPRIEYQCAVDLAVAREMSDRTFFHYVVVDGWMQSWEAGYAMGWDEVAAVRPWKWIFLVDTLPVGGLLDERVQASAFFIEKPFNPKEFPSILRKLEAAGAGEPLPAEAEETEGTEPRPLPLEPGETYRDLPGEPEAETAAGAAADLGALQPGEEPEDEFHAQLERGFACLKQGDLEGARACWLKALEIRPGDRRVAANLSRLEDRIRASG